MGIKIIRNPRGMVARDFSTTPLGDKYVDIVYSRRNRFGKFLRTKRTKRVRLPPKTKITLIENNAPRVGFVTIKFKKK